MEVKVLKREVYGTVRFYPLNDAAHKFADLLDRRTLYLSELTQIKELGFKITVEHEEVNI